MPKSAHKPPSSPPRSETFAPKRRKPVPFEFVLDALSPLEPRTRSMFGCIAVYTGEKIVLCLRDKPVSPADNGVWLATTEDHHANLRADFPHMRSIGVFGKPVTGWQVLPADAPDFEEAAVRACDMVLAGDPRIGKIPGARRKSPAKKPAKTPSRTLPTRRNNS